jgi:addiction module RelB/DinJ family antitoxin
MEVIVMATKTANVTARVQPEIKAQAEAVLDRIGIPVSVLIDTLYRQIIMTGGVPYALSVPRITTLDSMSKEQFDAMMQKGYDEAQAGIGLSVDEAFKKAREVV